MIHKIHQEAQVNPEVAHEINRVADPTLAQIALMFIIGVAGRALIANEPFDVKKFFGEVLLSLLGAEIIWSFGLMQGMTTHQMIFFGGLSAWGGLRSIQWVLKAANTIKNGPIR
jgi:hypothetical protein